MKNIPGGMPDLSTREVRDLFKLEPKNELNAPISDLFEILGDKGLYIYPTYTYKEGYKYYSLATAIAQIFIAGYKKAQNDGDNRLKKSLLAWHKKYLGKNFVNLGVQDEEPDQNDSENPEQIDEYELFDGLMRQISARYKESLDAVVFESLDDDGNPYYPSKAKRDYDMELQKLKAQLRRIESSHREDISKIYESFLYTGDISKKYGDSIKDLFMYVCISLADSKRLDIGGKTYGQILELLIKAESYAVTRWDVILIEKPIEEQYAALIELHALVLKKIDEDGNIISVDDFFNISQRWLEFYATGTKERVILEMIIAKKMSEMES